MTQQITPAPDHTITDAERDYVTNRVIPALLDELLDNGNTAHMFGPYGDIIHRMITDPVIKADIEAFGN